MSWASSSVVVMARMASMSSTFLRPRISASVRGSRSAIGACLSRQEAGEDERRGEAPGVVLVGEVEPFARRERVREHESGDPFGGAPGIGNADVGLEKWRRDLGGSGKHHVEGTEG